MRFPRMRDCGCAGHELRLAADEQQIVSRGIDR
jgi:hypothetical protein